MVIKKTILSLLLLAAVSPALNARQRELCLADINKETVYYGSGKAETCNVAVAIDDAQLIGSKIAGIKVPLAQSEGIIPVSGWLTSDLKVEKTDGGKQNVPDMASADANIENGWLVVYFDEPYTIEGSMYVGYTFTAISAAPDMEPAVAGVKGATPGGFYYFGDKTCARWVDNTEKSDFTSLIHILIEMDYVPSSVSLALPDETDLDYEAASHKIYGTIRNYGEEIIETLRFSIVDPDHELVMESEISFDPPLITQFAHDISVEIPVEVIEPGYYRPRISADLVNGIENANSSREDAFRLNVIRDYPARIPLVEEYTGLWCGWCPRGYAALEHMGDKYGDAFVAVSYHSNDYLEAMDPENFPTGHGGAPDAWLDRSLNLDPYAGTAASGFGFESDWLDKCGEKTIGQIDVTAAWADEAMTDIEVFSESSFVKPVYDSFTVGYALVEDGLSNEDWAQANYYYGMSGYDDIPEMQMFLNSNGPVKGLTFNDIMVAAPDIMGIPGSLPNPIQPLEEVGHEYRFDAASIISTRGESLLQHPDRLKVVAFILDSEGKVVNCNVCNVSPYSNVPEVIDSGIIRTRYFTLSGIPVVNPETGMYIKQTIYRDGRMTTTRIIH